MYSFNAKEWKVIICKATAIVRQGFLKNVYNEFAKWCENYIKSRSIELLSSDIIGADTSSNIKI